MYKCSSCGYISSKWLGKCPKCGAWGTFEEVVEKDDSVDVLGKKMRKDAKRKVKYPKLEIITKDIDLKEYNKISTGFKEVDRALAGGIFPGSVSLIGGEPGIGKSTLLMQILINLAKANYKVLYISAEESARQIASRVYRLSGGIPDNFHLASEINLAKILETLKDDSDSYQFIVFDSIQAFILPDITGTVGGITQVKSVVSLITNYAKTYNKSVFLVGQVTKEGTVSGPKTVEHIVDTVLYLEYIGIGQTRLIRSIKNRFGEVGEVGFIKMTSKGFKDNPNAESLFFERLETKQPGASFGITLQGTRPIAVQVQSLLNDSIFVSPKRVVEGLARNKVELLSAVITRKVPGVYLNKKDLYLKIIGGLSLKDAGIDLAVVASIVSAYKDKPLASAAFIGEVGLLGDVKPCLALDLRIKEAKKLGFKEIFTYKNLKHIKDLLELF